MDLETYRARWPEEDSSPGWDAIEDALAAVYGDQKPKHYAPALHAALGGPDPIDGISLYRSTAGGVAHLHLVTYGFSQLYYDEALLGKPYSRFGFELTLRLRQDPADDEMPSWAINMAQNIARYVFKSGRWFEPGHCMPAEGRRDRRARPAGRAPRDEPAAGHRPRAALSDVARTQAKT